MFGGHGLYRGDAIFGIVFKGRLYFKTGPRSRPDYVKRGATPFKPNARQTLKSYYEIPAEILESADDLRAWSLRAGA